MRGLEQNPLPTDLSVCISLVRRGCRFAIIKMQFSSCNVIHFLIILENVTFVKSTSSKNRNLFKDRRDIDTVT